MPSTINTYLADMLSYFLRKPDSSTQRQYRVEDSIWTIFIISLVYHTHINLSIRIAYEYQIQIGL